MPLTAGRFEDGVPVALRARTARGTIVNAAYTFGTSGIYVVQGIVLAALLSTRVYGLWGLLMAAYMTLLTLGSVGIDDKYIQQDDADQRRAFEIAFTLQMVVGAIFVLVLLVGMPLFGLIYGNTEIVAPGMALSLSMPALALQMTVWVHYRRMDFVRQRKLQLIDPVVTFVVTVALALAGLEIWALVVGAMAGSWSASAAMVAACPYRLRLRWDRVAFADYLRFSWPLFLGALSTVALIQAPVIVSSRVLGVTAVAGIALATMIWQFTQKVDQFVTQSLYPAICAVKDRRDLLFEAFWKSNRLALLWAAPLGAAVALFAGDFVHFVIGEKWRFAVPLIAFFGVSAALDQIAFNWTAFFRALGDTRPIAVGNAVALAAVLAIAVPLLATDGVSAFGAGMAIATAVAVGVRLAYLRRLFPGLPLARHIARGVGPTLPAVAAVLALRELGPGERDAAWVALEAFVFVVLSLGATVASERALLRESLGYLRRGAPLAATPA
jgi:O-antigen/teichoic acid export membrane protein